RELIADVPPMRDTLELKRMATSRLGKQVVDLIDVTQIFEDSSNPAGADADIVKSPFSQPTHDGSVTISVDESQAAAQSQESQLSQEESSLKETCAALQKTISGRMILDNQTWLIGPGDRFGIVGANGAGKSTLLSIIDGSLRPTKGHVNIGKTVKFAVLSQRLEELEKLGKYKVKEVLSRYKPSYIIDGKEVTPGQLMERLGFKPEQLMTPIADLSGGQKRRMQLLLILLNEPNVLIMDEPGNDLDTDMLAVMEDLLDTWTGTLIVVSHDRYLLERVTDQQFALIDGKIRHLPGGVDEYLKIMEDYERANMQESKADFEASSRAVAGDSSDADSAEKSNQKYEAKLSGKAYYDATRRVSAIERKLEKLEEEKSEIEQKMASHDPSDFVGLQELNEKLQANQSESSALEEEWLALSEQI
ncbi:ATP-binding cassette domain-containing protein, partial [Gardnerella vaginalis]|uniref:ATP-binding cassette domain-containing protein n=1 Tax=Gardnerella vaginalis TaxID=2702 RepID=UPI0003544F00